MMGRAVLVLCLLTGAALACDDGPSYVAPEPGADNVPLNAMGWVFDGPHGELRLRGDATERPLAPIAFAEGTTMFPLGQLRARTTYEIVEAGRVLTTFTTGTDDDHVAP